MMGKLDLNLLLDLEALLATGSVTAAARRLHVSPPAMSRRLAHLREALGDPLFVPAGRGLVPTARALALRPRALAAAEDIREILAPVRVDFATLERTFTLRANDGVIGAWAAGLSVRVTAEAPRVRLRFMPRVEKSLDPLRSGEVDLDLGVLPAPNPEIHSLQLLQTTFVGVVRAGHPLGKKRRVDAAQFVRWPHISASRRGHARGPIDTALAALCLKRNVVVVAPGFQAALAIAENSDFIATMPEPFARWGNPHQRLHIFSLPVPTPTVDVALSWHARYHADPVHQWLRGHVIATLRPA